MIVVSLKCLRRTKVKSTSNLETHVWVQPWAEWCIVNSLTSEGGLWKSALGNPREVQSGQLRVARNGNYCLDSCAHLDVDSSSKSSLETSSSHDWVCAGSLSISNPQMWVQLDCTCLGLWGNTWLWAAPHHGCACCPEQLCHALRVRYTYSLSAPHLLKSVFLLGFSVSP